MSANDPKRTFSLRLCGFRFFAKTFDVDFGLIRRLIDVFTDPGNVLVLPCRLYVDHDALPVGCADDPPIRESRISNNDDQNGCQQNPMWHGSYIGTLIAIRRIFAVLALRCLVVSVCRRIVAVVLFYRWTGGRRRCLIAIHWWSMGVGRGGRSVAINSWRIGVHDGRRIVAVRRRIVGIGCRIAITPVLAPPEADLLNLRCVNAGAAEARLS
jgi:hypothetical protein